MHVIQIYLIQEVRESFFILVIENVIADLTALSPERSQVIPLHRSDHRDNVSLSMFVLVEAFVTILY